MSIQRFGKIFLAIFFSVLAGVMVRTAQVQLDDCDPAVLDAVLDGGQITLADDCVMMLDYERVITGDVQITGGMLHGGGLQRVLHVNDGASLILKNVEIRVGTAELDPKDGGGIYNEGRLSLVDSRMKGNRANRGGAIFNTGHTTILRSQIDHNNARSEGGGIYNTGRLEISESIIAGNMATRNGNGIVNDGGTVSAQNNYWGYPTGPRQGQVVGVDESAYTPWLKTQPNWAFQEDDSTCSEAALDGVTDGGKLTLPDSCLIFVSETKIITGNVTITGGKNSGISAGGNGRVLEVNAGASLELDRIVITGGYIEADAVAGAGILNRGNLKVVQSHFMGNTSRFALGTAIYSEGNLHVVDSQIQRNWSEGGSGVGIYSIGYATIEDSLIAENTIFPFHRNRQTPEFGAGLFNGDGGEMTIRDSVIRQNTAPNGAGIFNFGDLLIEASAITFNEAWAYDRYTSDGGGIFNGGSATIRRSTISDNRARQWAGGIDNQGVMVVEDSEIIRNYAHIGGGAIFNAFEDASITISNSIIADNVSDERPERNNGLYNLVSLDYDIGEVHAINNFWGSPDGPGGDGPGSGDGVSGLVRDNYTPWLTKEPDWSRSR